MGKLVVVIGIARMLGRLLWLASAAGVAIGCFLALAAFRAEAAPAQAAAAALACAAAILPYVAARTWDELFAPVDMRTRIEDLPGAPRN